MGLLSPWEIMNPKSARVIQAHAKDWVRAPLPLDGTSSVVPLPPHLRTELDQLRAVAPYLRSKLDMERLARASLVFIELQEEIRQLRYRP